MISGEKDAIFLAVPTIRPEIQVVQQNNRLFTKPSTF